MEEASNKTKSTHKQFSVIHRKLKSSPFYKVGLYTSYALGISAIVYVVLSLNLFYIEHIEVQPLTEDNLQYIESDELRDSLVDVIGQRFFTVSPSEIEAQLLEEFPFIQELYVTKRIPKTILVRVSERTPVMVMNNMVGTPSDDTSSIDAFTDIHSVPSAEDILVDSDGFVLAQCTDEEELCKELPRCATDNTWGIRPPGSTIFFTELSGVVEIDSLFIDGSYDVVGYVVPESDTVVVQLEDGSRIIFSLDVSVSEQFSTFEYTSENLSVEGKTYREIDLRYDRPVLRVDKYTDWVTE